MRTILVLLAILAALSLARRLLGGLIQRSAGWKRDAAAGAIAGPLLASGFQDAGTQRMREIPGTLRLLVHPEDALCAVIHMHPRAGPRLDLVSRYRNGTSVTFTTSKSNGLDPRPGHPIVNAPGASPLALLARARSERPGGALRPVVAEIAAGDLEEDVAEWFEWRRTHAASPRPVAETARTEAA